MATVADMCVIIVANVRALYPFWARNAITDILEVQTLMETTTITTGLVQTKQYIAVAAVFKEAFIQGAPRGTAWGALESLMDATMEVMEEWRVFFFFEHNDNRATALPRSGGMVLKGNASGR